MNASKGTGTLRSELARTHYSPRLWGRQRPGHSDGGSLLPSLRRYYRINIKLLRISQITSFERQAWETQL
jgi:hypothetical protein